MSADLQQPAQAALAGIEPMQTPAPTLMGELLRPFLVGHLAQPAIVRVNNHNAVIVEVLLQQHLERHPRALPFLASWRFPDIAGFDVAYAHARQRAAELNQPGAEILAVGQGIELGTYQGHEVLRLIDCQGIDLVSKVAGSAGDAKGDHRAH